LEPIDDDERDLRALAAEASQRRQKHQIEDQPDEENIPERYMYKEIEIPIATTDPIQRLAAAKQFVENGLGPQKFRALYDFLADQKTDDLPADQQIEHFEKILKSHDELAYVPLVRQCVLVDASLQSSSS
jgi:hypothetical protein